MERHTLVAPHGRFARSTGPDEDELRRKIGDRRMIAWFYRSLKPYWTRVLLGLSAMLLAVGLGMIPPQIVRLVIDEVIGHGRMELLLPLVIGMVASMAGAATFSGLRMAVTHVLAQRMVYDLRVHTHRHLQKLSLSYFESTSTGDIMSRLSNDVGAVENMVAHGTDTLISDTLRVVVMVGIMVWMSWQIAGVALLPVPFFVVAMIWFAKKVRPYYREVRDQLGEINAHLQENIAGIRVVKAFAREKYEEEMFARTSYDYYRAYRKGVFMWTTFFPSMEFLTSLGLVGVIWVGSKLVHGGQSGASAGTLVAFMAYLQQLYGPVRSLVQVHNTINQALAALARIFEILDTEPEIVDAPDAKPIGPIRGRVEFEGVSFRYHTGEVVLDNVDLVAEPGQTVAIVGRSGAGKTSIVNLVPRFYDPLEGTVRVDGKDLRTVTGESLRSQIAIVLQDTFLFNDTVRENIRYGRLEATEEEIVEAAKAAYAHDFIMEDLPDGYDTEIGERGVKLSGGQKQRLAIARALLADPRILILDEATSSVDTEAERIIQAAINRLVKGRTTFVIAHRLSTIVNADQIIVLDNGKIVERGTHHELMALNGLYKEMYDRQFEIPEIDAQERVPQPAALPFAPPIRFPGQN
ncbi:MAG: ABC transporter ATP-binding protein, partial [Candidatus Zipacnadales bacterium]